MDCPYCGSDNTEFTGIDDGGGDYGDQLVEMHWCATCGESFEGRTVGFIAPLEPAPQTIRSRLRSTWYWLRWQVWGRWQAPRDLPF